MISWQQVQQSFQRSRGTQTDLWVRCITRKFNSIFLENWNQEHRKWKEYWSKNGGHESGAGDDGNPPTWQKKLCLWNTHTSNTHLCTDQETRTTVSNAAAESMKMVESPITKRSSKTFQSADSVLWNWTETFQSDIRVRYLFPSGKTTSSSILDRKGSLGISLKLLWPTAEWWHV